MKKESLLGVRVRPKLHYVIMKFDESFIVDVKTYFGNDKNYFIKPNDHQDFVDPSTLLFAWADSDDDVCTNWLTYHLWISMYNYGVKPWPAIITKSGERGVVRADIKHLNKYLIVINNQWLYIDKFEIKPFTTTI